MLTPSSVPALLPGAPEAEREGVGATEVVFLEDLAVLLRVSHATIKRRRRDGTFPIPELPSLDRRPRWSRQAVRAYLASSTRPLRSRRGRPPSPGSRR